MDIRYKGLTLSRDEHATTPGELALCAGLEVYDGALRPSTLPYKIVLGSPRTEEKLKYIHTLPSGAKNFIFVSDDNFIYVCNEIGDKIIPDQELTDMLSSGEVIRSIQSIGNTLIIFTDKQTAYALYNPSAATYKFLGQRPPFVEIQFSLQAFNRTAYTIGTSSVANDTQFGVQHLNYKGENDVIGDYDSVAHTGKVKAEVLSDITTNIHAVINRTNSFITDEGHFYANFHIRYCYRLYDGSMVRHSAPVFMPVCTNGQYLISHLTPNGKAYGTTFANNAIVYTPFESILTYKIRNNVLAQLREWTDIVESVDIFITPPVTRFDPGEQISGTLAYMQKNTTNNVYRQICQDACGVNSVGMGLNHVEFDTQTDRFHSPYKQPELASDCPQNYYYVYQLPEIPGSDYDEKILHPSAFFKIASFKISELAVSSSFKPLPLKDKVLKNLATSEQMADDYKSHNLLLASSSYVYNRRLNLVVESERLFEGFPLHTLLPSGVLMAEAVYSQNENCFVPANSSPLVKNLDSISIDVETSDGVKVVANRSTALFDSSLLYFCPLFYPDARAKRLTLSYHNNRYADEWNMSPLHFLNGASINPSEQPASTDAVIASTAAEVLVGNKIYTSEVDNPYHFPLEGINTVGSGTILGITSATRALSQGQFGQFPLMAFCTDGIYALSVASSGTFSAIHPVSREVCINPNSIVQLDQSVAFATQRSLCKLVESSVISFSDTLDGPLFRVDLNLPKFTSDIGEEFAAYLRSAPTPPQCFRTCTIINDYVNQRLLIIPSRRSDNFNESNVVALVYSIRNDSWSTALIPFPLAVVNSYPYSYLQLQNGQVVVLSEKPLEISSSVSSGIAVTRTICPEALVSAVTGFSHECNCTNTPRMWLYGSNDNIKWQYIGSATAQHLDRLPSRSFRFFRLALQLQMRPGERYFSTTLNITPKYGKQ